MKVFRFAALPSAIQKIWTLVYFRNWQLTTSNWQLLLPPIPASDILITGRKSIWPTCVAVVAVVASGSRCVGESAIL